MIIKNKNKKKIHFDILASFSMAALLLDCLIDSLTEIEHEVIEIAMIMKINVNYKGSCEIVYYSHLED